MSPAINREREASPIQRTSSSGALLAENAMGKPASRASIQDFVERLLAELAWLELVEVIEHQQRRLYRLTHEFVVVLPCLDTLLQGIEERHHRGETAGAPG